MNKRLKRLVSVLLAVAMCVCVVLASSGDSYAAKDQFSINLEASISQNQEYYEVEIEITNSGKDFSGFAELQVQSGYYYSYVGYDVAVSIPSGSTKTYTLKVPASATAVTSDPEVVVIYDTNKKKQYSEKFKGTFSRSSGILNLGILSDNADRLSFFDLGGGSLDLNGQKYKVSTEELSAGELDEALDGLDYLVINDYDTSVLSEEQIDSIDEFVSRGGYLIIGTGERGEEVLSGFEDSFLDVKYDGSYETPLYLNGNYEDTEISSIVIGSDYFYSGMVESYSKYYGLGSVEIIGFELSLLDDLDDYGNPPESVLQDAYSYSNNNMNSYDQLDVYNIENIQGYMEKPANMGSVALVLLVIVYVVLVGPIIYLILKKMNKREKMWIVIPAISLVFVFLVFLISFGVKVRGLTIKSVTVEQLGKGEADSIIFGYTPKPETWSIETKDEFEYGTAITEYDYNSQEGGLPKSQLLYGSGTDHLIFNSTSAFETGTFVMTGKTDPKKPFEIEMNASGTNANAKGTVVNNTGLSFDYVLVQNYSTGYQVFKNVADGDTLKVDFSMSSGYGYYSGSTTLLYNDARDEYTAGHYEDAAKLAAIAMATNYIDYQQTFVIGVRSSDSVTAEDEKAWHCYYSVD